MSRIQKEATVVEINDSKIVLEFCSSEACGSCAAKDICGSMSRETSRRIELHNDGIPRNVGDRVNLLISTSMGLKSAFVAYLLPVFVVLVAIFVLQKVGLDDLVVGVAALGVLLVYFVILWSLRKKLEKQISITIE